MKLKWWILKWLILVLGVLTVARGASASATDIYIAQTAAGSNNGTSCANAFAYTFFNTAANWGTGSGQIGPGTTVHLCGTFTGTANQQLLLVKGSGTNTSPITIKFETGAVLTAPYWNGQGAIYEDGFSYITIDGGTNGLIENSANGSGLANQQSNTRAIYAPSCTGCTVQNLTIANLYVRTSSTDLAPSPSTIACIYFQDAVGFTINRVTCHDGGWAFAGAGNNFTLENSEAYNVDHGLAFGAGTAVTNVTLHDNHFHDFSNWDSPNGTYHHDGVHLWAHSGASITGGVIYNNLIDGNTGVSITAPIYLQDSINNLTVFNNITIIPSNLRGNGIWFACCSASTSASGNAAYNNYMVGGGDRSQGAALQVDSQASFTALNNIAIGAKSDLGMNFGTRSSSGINNNLYDDLFADYGDTATFNFNSGGGEKIYDALTGSSGWIQACSCDSNSLLVTLANMKLSSTGVPQPGSPAIGLGVNLTNIATGALAPLAKDRNGVQRPSSGSWDAGAYVSSGIGRVQTINPTFIHASSMSDSLTETAGNLLVAATAWQLPGLTVSVTDTVGNTWHSLTSYANSNCGSTDGNYSAVQLWYAENIKGGSNTVTMQVNGTTYIWLGVVEYSGLSTSGSLLSSNGNVATTSSSTMTAGSVNASASSNLVLALFHDEFQTKSMSPGTGYTDFANSGLTSMLEDQFPLGSGNYNPSATYNSGSDKCGVATAAAFH